MNRREQVMPQREAAPSSDGGGQAFGGAPFQSVDLLYLYSVLRVNARLIFMVTLACVLGMFISLMYATPIYSAYARLLLDTRQERVTPAEEVVSNLEISAAVIAGEVVSIESNVLLGQVVDKLDLLNEPLFDPREPKSEPFLSWLKRMVRGDDPPHVVAQRLPLETLRSMVVDQLREKLSVQQLGVSYAIGIGFDSPDPRLAAAVTNAVAEGYIDSQLDDKLSASLRANAWLSDRLVELSQQVETSDAEVVEFRAQMIERAEGSEESIAQLLAELNTRLVESSTARADAEVRLSQVEALRQSGGLAAVSDVVTSPLLETLQRQRAELAAQEAQLASTLGRKHPEMIRIAAQIADLDRSMDTELNRRMEEMRSDVVVTRNREEALRAQIKVVSDRADALSRDSVRLGQLERTAEATRLVYENFLSRYKETSAQADFQTPEARVIGRAEVPTVPSAPRKTLLMIAAFGVGLSGAIIWVFLRNLVRSPVSTADELRSLTGRPLLSMLPNVRHFGSRFSWLQRELTVGDSSAYMEHVNNVRTSLFAGSRRQKPKVVLITSAVPGEGKSSLSCALARSLANNGSSVLLLDGDLRRPDIRKALKLPAKGACLVDYLEGKAKLADLVQHSYLAGYDVISPARSTSRAADLISVDRFEGLLTRMAATYDVVIVNAPPVIHLSDAVLLARKSDAVVFCVHCGQTPARVVRNAIERLQNAGITVNGTVLSMVRKVHAAARETEMYSYDY